VVATHRGLTSPSLTDCGDPEPLMASCSMPGPCLKWESSMYSDSNSDRTRLDSVMYSTIPVLWCVQLFGGHVLNAWNCPA